MAAADAEVAMATEEEPEADFIFIEMSYSLLPESFDEDGEVFTAVIDDLWDEDAIWLPSDSPEEGD